MKHPASPNRELAVHDQIPRSPITTAAALWTWVPRLVPSGSPTDEDLAIPYCPDVQGSNDFTEWATLETFTQVAKRGPTVGAATYHVLVKKEEDVASTGHPHHQTPPLAPRACADRAPLTDPNIMLAIDNREAVETNVNPAECSARTITNRRISPWATLHHGISANED